MKKVDIDQNPGGEFMHIDLRTNEQYEQNNSIRKQDSQALTFISTDTS